MIVVTVLHQERWVMEVVRNDTYREYGRGTMTIGETEMGEVRVSIREVSRRGAGRGVV